MPCITVCSGTGCRAFGSEKVVAAFQEELESQSLGDKVALRRTGCHGFCEQGVLVVIFPKGICYCGVQTDDAADIVSHTANGEIVERLLYTDPVTGEKITHEEDIPFYKNQTRIVFRNNSKLDPRNIDDYLALGGYSGLAKALSHMTSEQVVDEVEKSGLRGRGGAGFSTGRKWRFVHNSTEDTKYVIVNCDEGDPGAYMDRSLMEGNPHGILEGLIIGAYAMGASEGIIYVREEYPLAVDNVGLAIRKAEEYGLLGSSILGTSFDFNVKIVRGGGAFVCGEETALIASLEGKSGEPKQRPPYPAVSGLGAKPTNINNVETFANIPFIINEGAEKFASIGTSESKGTKIFSLVGKVNNTGLVEVPIGISLRDIVYKIGGGIPGGKKFKAVQTGGPSGGCIPTELLDTPVAYDELAKIGSIMGSGGMIVLDEDTCMVDIARYFLSFLADESCGKCLSCREGITQMLDVLTGITEGRGKEGDIELLERLAETVKKASMCALGQTAPNPVLTTLRYFRDEYLEHIEKKRCPALVCQKLVIANCRHTCPAGIDVPRYIRFIGRGMYDEALAVIREKIPFPSVCGSVCFHPCETRCRRGEIDDPIAVRALKRFAAEKGKDEFWKQKVSTSPDTGKRVAVVGSGPAGLTAAYYLAKSGHSVNVFEAMPQPGGMMRYGIPRYRLPESVLDKEIDVIREFGAKIELNQKVESLDTLLNDGYDAAFLTLGAHSDINMGLEGESLPGVIDCISFLRDVTLGKDVEVGNKVAVIGGGNAAIDASRVALRLGAKEVSILYRRTRDEMPATDEEINDAEQEGVGIQYLVVPTKVKQEDSTLIAECIRMELGAEDKSGRPRPQPVEGSDFSMDFDMMIVAIGQRPDIPSGLGIDIGKGNLIQTDPNTLATNKDGVFAGGDAVTGPASVIEAINDGRRAASSIDIYLGGSGVIDETLAPPEDLESLPELEEGEKHRVSMPCVSSAERLKDFKEIEMGFDEGMAVEEAKRCLMCDLEERE
ncbi:MAG: FAD-dependent oxidoreductase [Deltaproteobacteria bacterium]|nr:FAD-dependent oxidoreductase [Deltaproteobacteria bacterium]